MNRRNTGYMLTTAGTSLPITTKVFAESMAIAMSFALTIVPRQYWHYLCSNSLPPNSNLTNMLAYSDSQN